MADAEIAAAAGVLRDGGLVAFPTETVYGLGADATNPAAIRRLFSVKRRPLDHPVIVHLADADALDDWGRDVGEAARTLVASCWPGPLTVVVARAARVPDEVTGGLDTVGLRVPDQPVALALLRELGGGIAAPSANRFGRVSPTAAEHVRSDLGDEVDLVLDGGPCRVGVESTIVDCTGPLAVVVRSGGVPVERLEDLLGGPVAVGSSDSTARAPGTHPAHYAPRCRVVVVDRVEVATSAAAALASGRRVGLLASAPPPDVPASVDVLDAPSTTAEFARVLYARLREADAREIEVLLVVPPPEGGLGTAIADRLSRAAAASSR